MNLIRLFNSELLKLKRSLILLVALAIPGMVFVITTMTVSSGNGSGVWLQTTMGSSAIWSIFMLPMSITALTALQAQIEHNARAWSYSLTIPYSKGQIFSVKFAVILLVTLVMSLLVVAATYGGGLLGGAISPEHALQGELQVLGMVKTMMLMWLASILATTIQFAVATIKDSFAIPVVVGISGTFVALVATGSKEGLYFPWLLATNVLASTDERMYQAILTGSVGGILVFAIACYFISKRDWK